MTLTIFDLAPGDGVQINADPYKGSWATVETVGSDPPEVDLTGAPISEPFEWARVRIDDGVRIYTITYALEDLELVVPRGPLTRTLLIEIPLDPDDIPDLADINWIIEVLAERHAEASTSIRKDPTS